MTVWIEKKNNEFTDDYTFCAYEGFINTGHIVQFFSKPEKIHYKKNDIVVGCIQSMKHIANKLSVILPTMYIPEGAEKFAGREIHKSTVGQVVTDFKRTGRSVFVKPVATKGFPAQVLDPQFPLTTFLGQTIDDNTECWWSEVINFVSEYRLFLVNEQIVGAKNYLGDFRQSLDWNVVDKAIDSIEWHPKGYCLDFGITDKGQTLLIEANDGYSIGNYGLDCIDYCQLLKERFLELTA